MARRNKTCLDPVSAFGLVAGAFVAGIVTERAAGVTGKVETKAREQGEKLQKLIQANIESARLEIDKTTAALRRDLANAQEAIQGKTEVEWSEFEKDEYKPERYSHSNRIIKGRPYIITETTKSVGGQSFPAYLVLYGPKKKGGKWGKIKGDLYGAFEHLPLATQAAEKHSGIRKNTRRNAFGGKEARSEVLDSFYEHSRISPKAVNKGIVGLVFYVYKSQKAYEDAAAPTGPHDMDDMSEWAKVNPGKVVEVFVYDPNDDDSPLSEKDMLTVLVEGVPADTKASLTRYREEQYGRAERSHKSNRHHKEKA
tara:strand:- start:874 stop:1806 length:933 start_codon:yes stop_codon:yes gene_type:complete